MRTLFVIFTLFVSISSLVAHAGKDPLIWPGVTEGKWFINIEISASDGIPHLREDPAASEAEREWFLHLSENRWKEIQNELSDYLSSSLLITSKEGTPLDYEITFPNFNTSPPVFRDDENMILDIVFTGKTTPKELHIQWASQWSQLLIATGMEDDSELFTLGLEENLSFSASVLQTIQNPSTTSLSVTKKPKHSFLRWIRYGFIHVIPSGVDHLLFILGFCLCAKKLKHILYYSLLFTFAHSLSLAAMVSGLIPPLGPWIEVIIALSILWVGIEALFNISKGRKTIAISLFIFGLIHGMGFAGALGSGLSSQHFLLPLLGANLGIELAQILIMAGYALLFYLLRKRKNLQNFTRMSLSLIIIGTALKFCFERLT